MKVAIATDDEINIAEHFGRARGFIIYDVKDAKIRDKQFRVNNFTGHAQGLHGSGHSPDRHKVILKALSDCNVVISRGMGQRIYNDLRNAGIQAFIVNESNTTEAVQNYLDDKLFNHPDKKCNH